MYMDRLFNIFTYLILLCLSLVVLLSSCQLESSSIVNNPNKIGNDSQNIFLSGLMTVQDEEMYFVKEESYFMHDDRGLYKSNINGTNELKLVSGNISNINVVGNKIYYVLEEYISRTKNEGVDLCTYSLYSCNLDGSNKVKIVENCDNVIITSDYAYYVSYVDFIAYKYDDKQIPSNFGYLYRFDFNSKKSEELVKQQVKYYQLENDSLYFTDGNYKIYKMDLTDKNKKITEIYSENGSEEINKFIVLDDFVKICYDNQVASLDIKSNEKKIIFNNLNEIINGNNYVIIDNDLYYISSENFVCKLNCETNKLEQLHQIDSEMTNGILYLHNESCYLYCDENIPICINDKIHNDI